MLIAFSWVAGLRTGTWIEKFTLLILNPEEIVIAANSPAVASYLRLHAAEILQQLREIFGLEQAVRFRAAMLSLARSLKPD